MQKRENWAKKVLDFPFLAVYNRQRCDMIAMKREVAACAKAYAGFPWSECQRI